MTMLLSFVPQRLTTYSQGLEPALRLHISVYNDSIGLEHFIQLSIQFAKWVRNCMEDRQCKQASLYHLHSEFASTNQSQVTSPSKWFMPDFPWLEDMSFWHVQFNLHVPVWVSFIVQMLNLLHSPRLSTLLLLMFLFQLLPSSILGQTATSHQEASVAISTSRRGLMKPSIKSSR